MEHVFSYFPNEQGDYTIIATTGEDDSFNDLIITSRKQEYEAVQLVDDLNKLIKINA